MKVQYVVKHALECTGGALLLCEDLERALEGAWATSTRAAGDAAVMRRDNWALANTSQDQFGVWLHGTGTKGNLYLMFNNEQDGEDSILVDPGVKMAEGQWNCLEVRQKLGYDGDAINELWLNGARLGSSTRHNVKGGRPPVTLGYGIVAVNGGTQTNALTAYVDQAYTARSRAGC